MHSPQNPCAFLLYYLSANLFDVFHQVKEVNICLPPQLASFVMSAGCSTFIFESRGRGLLSQVPFRLFGLEAMDIKNLLVLWMWS
jgi:hypothetical protein